MTLPKKRVVDFGAQTITCICPGCGCKHTIKSMHWTGKATPRKLCDKCKRREAKHPDGD